MDISYVNMPGRPKKITNNTDCDNATAEVSEVNVNQVNSIATNPGSNDDSDYKPDFTKALIAALNDPSV